jgi:hypothetical protein
VIPVFTGNTNTSVSSFSQEAQNYFIQSKNLKKHYLPINLFLDEKKSKYQLFLGVIFGNYFRKETIERPKSRSPLSIYSLSISQQSFKEKSTKK